MLEMINRMRWDPAAELHILTNINPGPPATWQAPRSDDTHVASALTFFNVDANTLAAQWSVLTPRVAPLAWNSNLHNAAAGHNGAMIAADAQEHQLPGEPDLGMRFTNAGYTSFTAGAENIYAYADSVFYGHAGFAIDWGFGPGGIQSPAGHRNTMMNANLREVGIAITPESNPGTEVGPLVITQDFGRRTGNAFVTGVVFNDAGAAPDSFYTPGEGLGGVTVRAFNAGTTTLRGTTTTFDSGGYTLQLPAGTYDIAMSGGNLDGRVVTYRGVQFGGNNVKLDNLSSFIAAPGANWNNVANWSAGVPNGPGTTAVLGRTIPGTAAGPRSVTVDAPVTVGRMVFDGSSAVTVGGSGAVTLAGGGTAAAAITAAVAPGGAPHVISAPVGFTGQVVRSGAGALTIRGTQQHAAGAGVTFLEGRTDVETNAGAAGSRTLRVSADGAATRVNYLATQDLARLDVSGGARVTLTTGGSKAIATDELGVAGGTLDLTDNGLLVDYDVPADPTPTMVRGAIRSAYAGGAWTGPGITSSTAASTPNTAVGYAVAADVFNFQLDVVHMFFGRAVDETTMLARYTLEGDTNLDGAVTVTDFMRLRESLAEAGDWVEGDFDYDGRVTPRDYVMLRRNFGESLPGVAAAVSAADWAALNAFAAVVPEPATGMLLIGSLLPLRRHRRRNAMKL